MRFMDIAMDLPNDLAAAQALIAKLTAEAAERELYTARIHAERDAAIARATELEARNAVTAAQAASDADEIPALKDEVKRIGEILAAFNRYRFGKRSEPFDADSFVLALEEIEPALGLANARLEAAIDARDPSAKAKRRKMLVGGPPTSNGSSGSSISTTRPAPVVVVSCT